MTKHAGGRPPHQPTEAGRKQVEAMSSYGIPQDDIARVIGISKNTLEKHYREELDLAASKSNAMVAQNLFRMATEKDFKAIPAAIFWMKTRAGWRETQHHELTGPAGGAVDFNVVVKLVRPEGNGN